MDDIELLKKILNKLEAIETELRNLYEAIAINESEHKNFERQLEYLHKKIEQKTGDASKALAWVAMIVGILLTIVNLLQKL